MLCHIFFIAIPSSDLQTFGIIVAVESVKHAFPTFAFGFIDKGTKAIATGREAQSVTYLGTDTCLTKPFYKLDT